jgi:hypothetical protein
MNKNREDDKIYSHIASFIVLSAFLQNTIQVLWSWQTNSRGNWEIYTGKWTPACPGLYEFCAGHPVLLSYPVYNENAYETFELGIYYFPGDIIISNENKYIDYAVDSLSFIKRNLTISNKFVKGCVFHELTHIWFQQILSEMKHEVSPEHRNFRIYSTPDRDYGADFIEEGICEYVAHKAGEIIYPKNYAPDLENEWNTYKIKYQYAEYYVRQILDKYDNIKEGIKMILRVSPPNKEEIRNPELYYQRVFPEDNELLWSGWMRIQGLI